jgi:hypothetical protein
MRIAPRFIAGYRAIIISLTFERSEASGTRASSEFVPPTLNLNSALTRKF